ncbi:MAG TPA: carboxypeptidase-like regulatory domain-containing protein [Vicinamibacterales bacterium]|nr:carboxypeptidase-like regulatory domain-containing protein [Vicinamibacterales bacterium]
MSRLVGALLTAWLVSSGVSAQTPSSTPGFPAPPRDNSALPPAPSTAIIRGHVYDASNGKPLRKVQVRAVSPELRENRLAITDNNGAFEIRNLAAARYQLSAQKGSFVTLQYGQTRPFEQGKPIDVHDAQVIDKVDFNLPHGAVVTGRVVDETGEPQSNVQVTLQRYQYINGRRQLNTTSFASTNDIGEYRLFGVAPGQYFVTATMRLFNFSDAPPDDRSGYAPTYYGGSTNVNDAQRITLAVGQQLNDINIGLAPTQLARITGTAVTSDGKPLTGGLVNLIQVLGQGSFFSSIGAQLKPDGSFSVGGVAPGDYILRGQSPLTAGALPEQIQASLTVNGQDITDLRLVGVKPSSVSGRVVPPAGSQANLGELMILTVPKVFLPLAGGNGNTRVNEDGTFDLKAQPGVVYLRLNAQGAFSTTRIRTVRLNGVDVTDSGFEIKPNEDLRGFEVELTNQMASVVGSVSDARGNPARDYTVLLFPRDRERWETTSRYLYVARPDQEGKYKAQYVLPGSYYAIALDYLEQGSQGDPEFLDRIKERATELTINDTETASLDLKLTTAP